MAIFYKNQGYDLTTTNLTTVLNINTSSVAIIKEISVTNDDNSAHTVDYYFYDYSTSTSYKFYHTSVAANSHDNAVHNALVLEEGDYLQFKSNSANAISGQISYALLTRAGENG
jgi:BioD-like phosphotransacetylase family protein